MPRTPQAPPPGVVRNATPEATPGRWWDCNNVRFRGGQLQPIGGNVWLTGTGVANPVRDLLTWHDNADVRWAVFGTDVALYAYRFDTDTIYNITPAGVGPLDPPGALLGYGLADYGEDAYGTERDEEDVGPQDISATMGDRWSIDTFGQDLLIVPTQDGRLYSWSPATPATLPAIVAEAPVMNRGVIVTDQRHVVLLGAGGDPRRIAWSDQENYHVWTAAVANLAGDKMLQTQSYVMTAIKVGDGVLIFTANDVHKMTYVGPPYAYGIVSIAAGCGPMSLRCVVAIGNAVMWPGLQTFWTYQGTVQPAPCPVGDWFFSLVNRQMIGRVFGSPNPAFSEMWWDWPDEGALECNRYIALNYSDPTKPWMIGVRERTAGDPSGTMDFPVLGGPIGATDHCLYLHEYGWSDNGAPRAPTGSVYAETGNITLGEGDRRYHVRQVVIDDESASGLGFRFLTREQPKAVERDTGLYTVVHDGLMDTRFSARHVRMRVEALADEPWSLGRPRLIIRQGGKR
jgi:hypothetical protein